MNYSTHPSPVGELFAMARDDGTVVGLYLPEQDRRPEPGWVRDDATLAPLWRQLDEYFAGIRTEFEVPIEASGTAHQRAVWQRLREIPSGRTTTYGALAADLGLPPGAARAVGHAVGRNPISIVIPCHRVVGSTGALTGYAGGLPAKRWLLTHEGG